MQYNKISFSTGYNLNIVLDSFFLQQRKTTRMNLQKRCDSYSKQPSCKKGAALCKMASVKKVVKYKWWQDKKWL